MTTQPQFIEYLAGLAPEGETALIVRQKIITRNGKPETYLDGTMKATWLAGYPNKKVSESWAIYGNTGSFLLDRLDTERPSASSANCEYVLVLVLDDVGNPDKAPKMSPLEPTWKIETSEGSFQWGYVFEEDSQPTKGEFTAAIRAIAEAGYTDPGACNPVRNFRVPGSVNLKPGKNNFKSRLVEFHPDREFTLSQICEALSVSPDEADTGSVRPIRLSDTQDDTVLAWLNEQGLVLGPVNRDGWCAIVCPNHQNHSTPEDVAARYHPGDRAFACYHAHCEDLSSQQFLDWVAQNGGPSTIHGLRTELLTDTLTVALNKITPNEMFTNDAAQIIAEVKEKELGRVTKQGWYDRFAYILEDDAYFDLQERREVTRGTFNALYRHIECRSIHNNSKIEASVCFDQNRERHGAKALVGLTYAPGDTVVLAKDGELFANRWKDARPPVEKSLVGDISRWLEHGRKLVPDEENFEHLLNIMAFKLQYPDRKVNHAVLHAGKEGCGKDTFWAPFIWGVCGPYLRNRGYLNNDTLNTVWGYHLESEILLINELKEPDASQRRQLANRLKEIIAAPPEYLSINRKGLSPYLAANKVFVLAFSNDRVPISLASQDRRWFAIWSNAPRMEAADAKAMWDWYVTGGFDSVVAWLYRRDVSMFNPSAPPAETEYKRSLIENGMSGAESYLVDLIKDERGEFSTGIIGGNLAVVCDRLAGTAPSNIKIVKSALLHALEEAGWMDMGRLGSSQHPNKKQIYCSPTMQGKHSKSDLRNMIEELPESTLLRRVK